MRARDAVAPEDAEVAAFFDGFASVDERWRRKNRGYFEQLECVYALPRPAGGAACSRSAAAAATCSRRCSRPTGSASTSAAEMVELARSRHPELRVRAGRGRAARAPAGRSTTSSSPTSCPSRTTCSRFFENVRRHSHARTRVVINSYSQLWRPVIGLAELLGLKPRKPIRNWVSPDDVRNLLELAGLRGRDATPGASSCPKRVPLLSTFLNGFVANIWPFNHLCLTYWIVARPLRASPGSELTRLGRLPVPERGRERSPPIVERLPELGTATELIFVEGGSTDGTRGGDRAPDRAHPERDISLLVQTGKGKGDAVRAGFAAARNDVLMILDGDLTRRARGPAEVLPRLVDGRAELVNGSRLVYDLEPGAMRFLNMLGNKLFSLLFSADRRPAREGHALRDEGPAPRRLRRASPPAARTSATSTRSATSTSCSAPRGSR